MDQLKGFYFSLDALTASMILLAAAGMLMTFSPQTDQSRKPFALDKLYTTSLQQVEDWNSSKESKRTVLTQIHYRYQNGEAAKAEELCSGYFNLSRNYALYFSNTTDRTRVCGTLNPSKSQNLEILEAPVADVKVNGSFVQNKKAVMVVRN